MLQKSLQSDSTQIKKVDKATGDTISPGSSLKNITENKDNLPVYAKKDSLESKTETPSNFFHSTYSKNLQQIIAKRDPSPWVIPLLMVFLIATGMMFTIYSKEFKTIISGVFRQGGFRKVIGEDNFLIRRTQSILLSIHLFSLPLFVFLAIESKGITFFSGNMAGYFKIFLICNMLLGLKLGLVRFLGIIFSCQKESGIYSSGIIMMSIFSGILLIPVSLALKLSGGNPAGIYVWTGWGIILVSYILSLAIGISVGLKSQAISKFHLFLYLCTLEILPVIIFVKAGYSFL